MGFPSFWPFAVAPQTIKKTTTNNTHLDDAFQQQQSLPSHFAIPPDNRAGARLSYLYVANIVGHEMGHAFGVLQHSTDPSDLMFGSRNQKRASYPWITVRDLNTMSEAYCR